MKFLKNIFNESVLKRLTLILFCFFCFTFLNFESFSQLKNCVKSVITTDFTKQAVRQNDNIVSVFLGSKFISLKERPLITLPFDNYVLNNGIFNFDISSNCFVKSVADGVVKNIGYKENEKYIEILHSGNIKTVYQNIDIVGVNENLKVKSGEIVSTVNKGSFKFYLMYNNEIITDYYVKNGEIVWKN